MKVRQGFVSNSSSSSFIVSFKKKPKTKKDVYKEMFNERYYIIDYYDIEKKSTEQISDIVFNDLKTIKQIKSADELIPYFLSLYNYYPHDNPLNIIYYLGHSVSDSDGEWSGPDCDRCLGCWGSDIDLLEKIKKIYVENKKIQDSLNKEHQKIQRTIQLENGLLNNEYVKLNAVCKKNKKYMEIDEKIMSIWRQSSDEDSELNKLKKELAKKDSELFFKKFSGYIVCLEYADESGEALMEHADIFRNLPHFKISNH